MGTRSFIAIANPKGDYSAIYCHYDGYPEYMGAMLRDNYKSKGKARALIRLGDCSSIKPNLAAIGPHTFESRAKDVTIAYGRDRGDNDCKARTFATVRELADYAANSWAEYIYIFDGKRWHWAECSEAGHGPFETL